MRITLVIGSLAAGGAERVLSLLAGQWAARGDDVTLITSEPSERDFYPLDARVTRVSLHMAHAPTNKWQTLRHLATVVFRLRRALQVARPDVVISFIETMNVLTLLAGTGRNFPIFVSERTDPRQYAVRGIWRRLRRALYPRARAVVVQTQSVRAWAETFLPAGRIHVVPNPVLPPPAEDAANSFDLPPGPRVVAMGRLGREKGFDLLLRAFAACSAHHAAWSLLLLGDGAERTNLQQLAADLGITDRVRFCGRVTDPWRVLRRADLFVLSSRFEGFPNALLEAMACGLPVISANCPSGPGEILRDGTDGILVPPENADALAAAMDRLMGDADARRRLAARATEVTERFSPERVLAQWDHVIATARGKATATRSIAVTPTAPAA